MNILAVACSYNPMNWESHKINLKHFYDKWPLNIPLKVLELGYGKNPQYILDDSIKMKTSSVLWQKEKCLNYLIKNNWDGWDAILWVDADICLVNPSSALQEFKKAFDKHDVIQGFRRSFRMNKEETADFQNTGQFFSSDNKASLSLMSEGLGAKNKDLGLIWGARTDWLRQVGGLYDYGILGGGDYYIINSLKGNIIHENKFMGRTHELYTYKVKATSPSVGFADIDILHQYHGSMTNRKYEKRYDIARKYNYDPYTDLKVSPQGICWEWSDNPNREEFHKEVFEYFCSRKEDSL